CEAINRLVSCITLPLFTFQFMLHTNPFAINYRFVAADATSKVTIALLLAAWPKCSSKGSYCWSVTSFSLATLTNSLVVGVPLVGAMYGLWAQDLVVQLSVVQAIMWLMLLMFVFELRKAGCGLFSVATAPSIGNVSIESPSAKDADVNVTSGSHGFEGMFMALQDKILACGPSLTSFGMTLKFIAGTATTAIGAIAACIWCWETSAGTSHVQRKSKTKIGFPRRSNHRAKDWNHEKNIKTDKIAM
ncbi:hypothetical protein BHM03_00040057, partial [Ensete ventricosum]